MNNIKQYAEIVLPKLNDSQKAGIAQATNTVGSYSGEEFEEFVLERLKFCRKKINENTIIGRVGGTGDMGIDIYENTNGKISYYQCKRYNAALNLPDFVNIVVKILWHCYNLQIKQPNKLYVIAYKGVKSQVMDLLGKDNYNDLKTTIINDAGKALSRMHITNNDGDFIKFLEAITDFNFIEKIDFDTIVTEYCLSPYASIRFINTSPSNIKRQEAKKENYSEHAFYKQLSKIVTKNKDRILLRAKEQYYSALCLEETDKYLFGNNDEFLKLVKEVASNIEPVRNQHFDDMFARFNEIILSAMHTLTTNIALDYNLHIIEADDKAGVCHKLVEMNELFWDKEDGQHCN